MRKFIVFICVLFTFGVAYADEYTLLCPENYYLDGEHCMACPTGYINPENNTNTECTRRCPDGEYWFYTQCRACPNGYPHTDQDAMFAEQCYSDPKTREYDGTVECRTIPNGCTSAVCEYDTSPEPCEYVEYYGGAIKSGCDSNPCLSDTFLSVASKTEVQYAVFADNNMAYNPESGICEPCSPGTYYTIGFLTGAGMCEKCDAGTYNPNIGASTSAACQTCPAGTYSTAGAAACTPCEPGTYSAAGAAQCTPCPDGMTSGVGATQCVATVCDAGYYGDGTTCDKCPDDYPNSYIGATEFEQCYSDTKSREWTGEQITPDIPTGCADAIFGECKIDACEYVAYCAWWIGDGTIKSGCETNNANCTKPILSVTANPGYIVNGQTCTVCPAGTYSPGGDTTKCITCPKNTYSAAGAAECTPCPDDYPNADAGATSRYECYSNEKWRPWTGHQVCNAPAGCIAANCAPCEIKPCKYVAYYTDEHWWDDDYDGVTKSGCPLNNANCSTPVQSAIARPGWRTVGVSRCEICPMGTYSAGGGATTCDPCPDGATSFNGAASRDECMRILNYLKPGDDDPIKILLSMKKPELPALAVKINNDIFYGNMTPMNTVDKSGLYVGYNNQKYMVQDNTDSAFYIQIITETNTAADPTLTSFVFYISAAGEFTVDWGDGTVEDFVYETVNEYRFSHDYGTAGRYTVAIRGRATAYSSDSAAIRFGYDNEYWWLLPTDTENRIHRISGSLGTIFPTLDDGTNPSFRYIFNGASNLSGSIPVGLFGNRANTAPASDMFVGAFEGCTNLTGPAARNLDGTRLYDTKYNGAKWIDAYPGAFTDMYKNSGINN